MCGGVVSVGDPSLSTDLIADQLFHLDAFIVVTSRTHLAKFLAACQLWEKNMQMLYILMIR